MKNKIVQNKVPKVRTGSAWRNALLVCTGIVVTAASFGCKENRETLQKERVQKAFDPVAHVNWLLKNAKIMDQLQLQTEIEKLGEYPKQLVILIISSKDDRVWNEALILIRNNERALKVALDMVGKGSGNFKKITAIKRELDRMKKEESEQAKVDGERI